MLLMLPVLLMPLLLTRVVSAFDYCYPLCRPNLAGTPSQGAARPPLCVMEPAKGAPPNNPLDPTAVIATGEPGALCNAGVSVTCLLID
jgi:hypothetical protein